jgi:hypothetical protein
MSFPASPGYSMPLVMDEVVKRLMWSGLLAGLSAMSSFLMARVAAQVWRRVFDEEPPG